MSWRVANSLITLRNQINTLYPGRNKASDGTIGDAAHAATVSDHNPDARGVVAAFDITHDPVHGLDIAALAQHMADSRDNRIKYLIRNRQILIPPNWNWQAYNGSNPHTSHLHVSVLAANYDDSREWGNLAPGGKGSGAPATSPPAANSPSRLPGEVPIDIAVNITAEVLFVRNQPSRGGAAGMGVDVDGSKLNGDGNLRGGNVVTIKGYVHSDDVDLSALGGQHTDMWGRTPHNMWIWLGGTDLVPKLAPVQQPAPAMSSPAPEPAAPLTAPAEPLPPASPPVEPPQSGPVDGIQPPSAPAATTVAQPKLSLRQRLVILAAAFLALFEKK